MKVTAEEAKKLDRSSQNVTPEVCSVLYLFHIFSGCFYD